MSAMQVPLNAADREQIDAMCAQYRKSIEHLYEMAFLQGQIAQVEEDRAKSRKILKEGA